MIHKLLRVLFLLVCGSLIIGQLSRVEFGSGAAIYAQDVLIALSLLLMFPLKNFKQRNLLLLLNAWIVMTSLVHFREDFHQLVIAFLYLVRFDAILLYGVQVFYLLQKKILSFGEYTSTVFAVPLGIALLGLFQYALYPDTRGLKLLGWDDHYYRLISTIFDPGFTGIILVIGVLLLMTKIVILDAESEGHGDRGSRVTPATLDSRCRYAIASSSGMTALLCFVAVLLTYSRASYLALAAGILTLVFMTKKLSYLLVIAMLAVGIVFLPRPGGEGVKLERTASITARTDSISAAVEKMTLGEMIIGKGWYVKKSLVPTNSVGPLTVPNHSSAPENSYIFIFSSLGIVGSILFLGVFGQLLFSFRETPEIVAIFAAVGAHALFSNTLFHPFVLLLLVLIMAGSGRGPLGWSRPVQN